VSTILPLEIQGIIARSFSPTCSIWCSSLMRRDPAGGLEVGWPTAFSCMKSRTNLPVWMSLRTAFIRALVSS
jgi:hypothetical protein